jgi:two-component system chemotaxis sensor kinase CheA
VGSAGGPAVSFGGDAIALGDLPALLEPGSPAATGPVAVLSTTSGRYAFRVDAIDAQRDVVVKQLSPLVPRSELVAGAGVEPDGSIILVLDPVGLIRAAERDGHRPESLAPPVPDPLRVRILVVDDAATVRELERSILERAGYAVVTAVNGAHALELLRTTEFDLVLTDIEMPGIDGVELTRAIRAREWGKDLPVLALTSREDDADRERGIAAGVNGYLLKSEFDEHRLVTTVAALLEGTA